MPWVLLASKDSDKSQATDHYLHLSTQSELDTVGKVQKHRKLGILESRNLSTVRCGGSISSVSSTGKQGLS